MKGAEKIKCAMFVLVAALLTYPAEAEPLTETGKRVALVIGNSAYRSVPQLANPKNDAADMATKLREIGFDVIDGDDLDLTQLRATVKRFIDHLEGADLSLFYYAGHGVQVDGVNYIAPVDARLASYDDLDFEALPMDLILSAMERKTEINLVFLDACRDNPFAVNLAKSMGTRSAAVGQGLAKIGTGIGSLIAFATQPGNVALDGVGRNSPFTGALLKHLGTKGQSITDDLILVRREVLEVTQGRQVPWDNSSLTGPVVLVPRAPGTPAPRLELALVAVDASKGVGHLLHDFGNPDLTYSVERNLTFPGDVETIAVAMDQWQQPFLSISLAEGAVKRLNQDAELRGRQLAMVLDGRTVLSVATVQEPLGRNIAMSGNYTLEDIQRLVEAIVTEP